MIAPINCLYICLKRRKRDSEDGWQDDINEFPGKVGTTDKMFWGVIILIFLITMLVAIGWLEFLSRPDRMFSEFVEKTFETSQSYQEIKPPK